MPILQLSNKYIYLFLFQNRILQPSNYKSSGMSSKLSGGIGMGAVGTKIVGGVMSSTRNSISFGESGTNKSGTFKKILMMTSP